MAIKSDAAGFLVGELVKTNDELLATQHESLGALKGIRRDVSAIARALNVQVKAQARSTTSGRGGQRTQRIAPATTASRGSRTVGGNAVGTRTVAQAAAKVTKAAAAVAVAGAGRDAKGRFTKAAARGKQGADEKGEADAGIPSESTSRGLLGKIAGGIGQLNANLGAADNIDPTVNAMKEVTDVVSPLGRGLSFMFGRTAERRKERWYMRIIKAIQTPITKKGQEAVPAGRSGSPIVRMLGTLFGGPLGKLGAVFAAIPSLLMGLLSRIFLPLAAIWGAWELGKWIGEKIYAWLDESGWNQKLFDAVDWLRDTFSNAWKAVGEGIDSVVGMIEGAWKTITDGFKSALDAFMEFPKKIGEFFSGLDEAMRKLPVVGKAYAAAADAIKSTADDAKRGYEEGKSGTTDKPAQTATQAIARDAGKAVAAAQEVGSQARAGFTEARGGQAAAGAPSGVVQKIARGAGSATGTVANWMLGKTSERYESGGKGAGTVSTGDGDHGGASYGTYQLASKTGTLKNFLNSTEYGEQFKGLTPGTAAFNAKWKEIAKTDATFGDKQHKFIEDTHYTPQMQTLQKAGIDLSGRGAAVKDAVWSTSVQFGGKSSLIKKALAGKDSSKMSDAEIVSAIQDYKTANNDTLFASSSAKVRAGTLNRATSEKAALLKLDAAQASNVPPPASASVPSAVPAKLPEQAADTVPTQLNASAAGAGKVQVSLNDKTSQNIGDRGIAQIVTGGIGAG